MKHRIIPHAVPVNLSYCRILSMKSSRHELAADHPNLSGLMGVHGRHPFSRAEFVVWHIDMGHLPESMNTGICSPGTVQLYRL
jgi:hypothetical protein